MSRNDDQKRELILGVSLSNVCDKACGPCCSDSSPEGRQLPYDSLESIARQLNDYSRKTSRKIHVEFSGGEPILYEDDDKNIVDVVKMFHQFLIDVGFITSGRSIRNPNGFKKIVTELQPYLRDILPIGISANLYMCGGLERTKLSISDLGEAGYNQISIAMLFDSENFKETITNFVTEVSKPLRYITPTGLFDSKGQLDMDYFKDHIYENKRIVFSKSGYELQVRLRTTRPNARNNDRYKPLYNYKSCYVLNEKKIDFNILADGTVLPCCTADMTSSRNLVIGNIHQDSFSKMIERKDIIIKDLQRHIKGLNVQEDICYACTKNSSETVKLGTTDN